MRGIHPRKQRGGDVVGIMLQRMSLAHEALDDWGVGLWRRRFGGGGRANDHDELGFATTTAECSVTLWIVSRK